jgi:hypothetical protein
MAAVNSMTAANRSNSGRNDDNFTGPTENSIYYSRIFKESSTVNRLRLKVKRQKHAAIKKYAVSIISTKTRKICPKEPSFFTKLSKPARPNIIAFSWTNSEMSFPRALRHDINPNNPTANNAEVSDKK